MNSFRFENGGETAKEIKLVAYRLTFATQCLALALTKGLSAILSRFRPVANDCSRV